MGKKIALWFQTLRTNAVPYSRSLASIGALEPHVKIQCYFARESAEIQPNMKRRAEPFRIHWRDHRGRKPLMLRDARQLPRDESRTVQLLSLPLYLAGQLDRLLAAPKPLTGS